MDAVSIMAISAIIVVLLFDYTNGFHDASNIIGTIIASRAMTPVQSVIVVAVFELLGPVLGGTAVANTIGKFIKLDDLNNMLSMAIILTGLFGAIFWNILTWWFGLPSSSSHALVGGLAGAVLMAAGSDHVNWGVEKFAKGWSALMAGKPFAEVKILDGVVKVVASLILSPIMGFWVGFVFHKILMAALSGAKPSVNVGLRRFQFISAASLAFSHGSNDAQKSMGILTLVLFLWHPVSPEEFKAFHVPLWVVLACAGMITLGILSGGWRIVRTVGFGIFKVRPIHAMGAQLTAGTLIFGAAQLGMPVSTTHVASSAIMGVGSSERPKAVRWAKAKELVSTWFITIPGSGVVGALTYLVVNLIFGLK